MKPPATLRDYFANMCGPVPRTRPVLEKHVQAQIVQLLRAVGGKVYVLGTRRPASDYPGTRQTPGLPDLLAFVRGHFLCIEVKAAGGRLRPAQQAFRADCESAGVTHLVGGLDQVQAWLEAKGVIRLDGPAVLITGA